MSHVDNMAVARRNKHRHKMDSLVARILLDDGLLSEILAFLPRPFELASLCQSIRQVLFEVAQYRVRFSGYPLDMDLICKRVKDPFVQITPSFCGVGEEQLGDHIAVLEGFRRSRVQLSNWGCEDSTRLARLTENLIGLFIYGNREKAPEWSFIGAFRNLETLKMQSPSIRHIAFVVALKGLKYLSFDACPVSDLSPIENLISLEHLTFGDTKVTRIEPLRNLVRLKELSFLRTAVVCLQPLRHMQSLKILHLSLLDEAASTSLPALRSLRRVVIWSESLFHSNVNAVADRLAIQGRSNIQTMNFVRDWTEITSLSVHFFESAIVSLHGLEQAKKLKSLDISCTHVTEVDRLTGLHALEYLNADGTMISDVEPLCALPSLRELRLMRTLVTNVESLRQSASLENLYISKGVRGFRGLIKRGVEVFRA